ncbi:pyridoxamine 5'-phosphate oxidase family protein [Massilia sp. CCM 9210]|uniref:pyridoxamine 5'-phosphate oxidase family protein n=1 Tax=Massilia scottii TaxID=3057166 RepID=UPI002796B4B4|nr:pyridoxamine 5'-phosphate oxidase family protein [Massilia sp. CCM 9210]MDQ1813084.1 pyridoxamine 5'-phosphate oxidase family protein [Massilia sp. CCM 9210]
MTQLPPGAQELAGKILAAATDLTLASIRDDGTPHASTVSFAADGLVLYVAIALDSHKAHNLRTHPRVALTVNAPYRSWNEIQGLSMDAMAEMIHEPVEAQRAASALLAKFPAFVNVVADTAALPWPGMLFVGITPLALSVLDYTKGFGHTEFFDLRGKAHSA